jgi:hypothetical protein
MSPVVESLVIDRPSGSSPRLEVTVPRIATRSVDDAKNYHLTVNDSVVNHIGVVHERNASDARPVLDLLCAFGKLRDPLEHSLYSPFEPHRREWIFRPNSKYPPAEPGALIDEPLEAAVGSLTRPAEEVSR